MSQYFNFEYANCRETHYSIALHEADPFYSGHGYISKNHPDAERLFDILKDGKKHRVTLEINVLGPFGGRLHPQRGLGSDIFSIQNLVSDSWILEPAQDNDPKKDAEKEPKKNDPPTLKKQEDKAPTKKADSGDSPNIKGPPTFLPADVRGSWENAPGFTVGWMAGLNDQSASTLSGIRQGKAGELPAFRFFMPGNKIRAGMIENLKAPDQAFGLSLTGTNITDDVLKEVGTLKKLHALKLFTTSITNNGLKHLAGLEELEFLGLGDNTRLTSTKELPELTQLRYLSLSFTVVDDGCLKDLKRLKALRGLDLYGTKVSDDGLKTLAELTELRSLDLRSTYVTDAAIKQLQTALPNLKIMGYLEKPKFGPKVGPKSP